MIGRRAAAARLGLAAAALALPLAAAAGLEPVPRPVLDGLEPAVEARIAARQAELDALLSRQDAPPAELAAAFGALGMLYHAHQLAAAEPCYRNAAELAPEDVRWPYYLALLALEDGRFADAVAGFAAVVERRSDDVAALLRLGTALRELGRLEEARATFERVLALDSAAAAAAEDGLGRTALAAGDLPAAIAHLERALALQPAARRLHALLAQAYRKLGDGERAAAHAGLYGPGEVVFPEPRVAALRAAAAGADFHLVAGDRALAAGHLEAARESYRRALAAEPANARAERGLGAVYEGLGELEEARRHFAAAVELEPRNPRYRHALARLLLALGEQRAAADELAAAVRLDPQDDAAQLDLASVELDLGQAASALARYDAVLARSPQSRPALVGRARSLKALGRHAEAAAELRALLARLPEDAAVRLNLATALIDGGDLEGGEEELRRVLELEAEDGVHALAYHNLGVIALRRGREESAAHAFAAALELDPEAVDARFQLANLLARGGRYGEAAEHYLELLRRVPAHRPARLAGATALALAGRYRQAADVLATGLETTPEDLELKHVLASFLASCPDPAVRDGRRAVELALEVFAARPTLAHGETVAIAHAAAGNFAEAVRWQRRLLAEAEGLGDDDWTERLASNLARFERGENAPPPWEPR
ncbi:MAG: tetratricopeptide repeat protein [Acidobacteria bacterium]|nr:MAG: tetratricopeptide repeat protein [Acidobacteriota bacterium]